jgi:3-hydroxyisobutyrate dehydrogenase-like beta-hydroxyacid dehydrogenase
VIVGLLHPGEMGAAVGATLVAAGHDVLWASEGRSNASTARATQGGLQDAGGVAALAARAEVILSICPPAAALDIARAVATCGFAGVYVDANAVSPARSRELAALIGAQRYVDGAIVGGPPSADEHPRLYLSGTGAAQMARLMRGTRVDARVVDEKIGTASAIKMAYAAWTKGSAAMLLAISELARAEGIEQALRAEWADSQPGLEARLAGAERSRAAKGWRWVGEMHEIADTFAADGLPEGFHRAAAEVFSETSERQGL